MAKKSRRKKRTTKKRVDQTTVSAERTTAPELPEGLNEAQYAFCLDYLANGFNASAAYRSAHPGVTDPTAWVEGHRTLRNPNVRTFIASQLENRWAAAHMSADEALALVAGDARADVRVLFNETGTMLSVQDWPDAIASSVEAIEQKDDGSIKVKLASKTAARRMILEVHRKLKAPGEGGDTAESLAALLAKHYKP